jgi:hypothetical protein
VALPGRPHPPRLGRGSRRARTSLSPTLLSRRGMERPCETLVAWAAAVSGHPLQTRFQRGTRPRSFSKSQSRAWRSVVMHSS